MGKTSLVHRYITNSFPSPSPSTIGASFLTKKIVDAETNSTVRLQIWDTAGQERFRSISRLYYRGANACIICYSITEEASFVEMGRWLAELRKELGEGCIIHVVGTKADLVADDPAAREVPFERTIAYVADNLFPHMGSTPPPTAGTDAWKSPALSESMPGLTHTGGFFDHVKATVGTPIEEGISVMPRRRTAGAEAGRSKRSSGFWGQDVGWDCCHEVSAESGEGVEEVFRVIARKLVEQQRKQAESVYASTPGMSPYPGDGGDYFGANANGSFRVGRDRRSWYGFPSFIGEVNEAVEEEGSGERKKGKKCC